MTSNAKCTSGVEFTRESIDIIQITTDDNGNLKIKQVEEFTDSKGHADTHPNSIAGKPK